MEEYLGEHPCVEGIAFKIQYQHYCCFMVPTFMFFFLFLLYMLMKSCLQVMKCIKLAKVSCTAMWCVPHCWCVFHNPMMSMIDNTLSLVLQLSERLHLIKILKFYFLLQCIRQKYGSTFTYRFIHVHFSSVLPSRNFKIAYMVFSFFKKIFTTTP